LAAAAAAAAAAAKLNCVCTWQRCNHPRARRDRGRRRPLARVIVELEVHRLDAQAERRLCAAGSARRPGGSALVADGVALGAGDARARVQGRVHERDLAAQLARRANAAALRVREGVQERGRDERKHAVRRVGQQHNEVAGARARGEQPVNAHALLPHTVYGLLRSGLCVDEDGSLGGGCSEQRVADKFLHEPRRLWHRRFVF